jgi:ketosteroid isomerase-like protein
MSRAATLALLETYYAAFNAGDWDGMLACLSDDVAHDINQGSRQVGKDTFAAFLGTWSAATRNGWKTSY